MKSKTELRQIFRARLQPSACATAYGAEELCYNLELQLKGCRGIWGAYQPAGFEADIRPLFAKLTDISWVFPHVSSESDLHFYRPLDPSLTSSSWIKNRWGILEPNPAHCTRVSFAEIQGLLVPGLVFDSKCNRLGRGRGYYDRALAEIRLANPMCIAIGVAFETQLSEEELPVENFDQPMDRLVTEKRTLERKSS